MGSFGPPTEPLVVSLKSSTERHESWNPLFIDKEDDGQKPQYVFLLLATFSIKRVNKTQKFKSQIRNGNHYAQGTLGDS